VGGYSPYIFQYACALFLARATNTRKSGPIPEYTIPILGETTATRSIIESSTRIEEDFFSVAITIPFDADERSFQPRFLQGQDETNRGHTFDTQTSRPLRYGCQSMFDLDQLSAG